MSHGAQFSVKDCSVGDGRRMEIPVCAMMLVTFKVKAVLGFPHEQDIAIPHSFPQWAGPKALGNKIPAITTHDHLYLWYPI